MKRVVGVVVVTLVVVAAVILLVPGLRDGIFGEELLHRLEVGRPDNITALSLVLIGTEIRPISSPVSFTPSDTITPEAYDVKLNMQEMVETASTEDSVLYNVVEARSRQIGNTGVGDLAGAHFRLRMPQTGLVTQLTRTEGKPSRAIDDDRMAELLAGWWVALPKSRVKLGDSWNGRWVARIPLKSLDGQPVEFVHNVTCTYEETVPAGKLTLAKISVKGSITPKSVSALPAKVEIVGTGSIEGSAMVCIENGCTVISDNHSAVSYVVRQLDEDMEVARLVDMKSRLYRPRMLPNGGSGFDSSIPGDGEDLPMVKDAAKSAVKPVPKPATPAKK